jgi:cyclopropane-fatty-acyl-phospholipid synthase
MSYSSALFDGAPCDLARAQDRKMARLADSLRLDATSHVLEIGCGWGGLAEYLARRSGCRVTALTISPAQADYARRRIFESGLNDWVAIELCDYRDARGTFDALVSVEMIEAVGEAWWPTYFDILRDRVREGGRVALQAITIREKFFDAYRREIDIIRRDIFPGGMLPTRSIIKALAEARGLRLVSDIAFGDSYARTLREWRESFIAAWPVIARHGFDTRFRRLWEYYLAYCEAGFATGTIDVSQLAFQR